jgi:Flp pilus assembly protein TadB
VIVLLAYMALGEDLTRVARPRVRNYRLKYGKYMTRSVLIPAISFGVLGLLMRDIILTPFLLVLGGVIAWFRIQQAIAASEKVLARDVLQVVLGFRAAYQLRPAVFDSLKEAAKKVQGPLRDLCNVVVETFFLTSSSQRAFEELRKRTDNMLLTQFAYILEMSESASNESMTEALDAFVTRLRHIEDLERQVQTGLTGITGQTSFMQVLFLGIAFAVALIPGFHDRYTESIQARLGYMAIMAVIVGTSYVIEKQIIALKEQVL